MDLTPLPYTDTAPPSAARTVVAGAKALVYGLFRMSLWTLGLAWLLAVASWRVLAALGQQHDNFYRRSEEDQTGLHHHPLHPRHPDYWTHHGNLARNGDVFDYR